LRPGRRPAFSSTPRPPEGLDPEQHDQPVRPLGILADDGEEEAGRHEDGGDRHSDAGELQPEAVERGVGDDREDGDRQHEQHRGVRVARPEEAHLQPVRGHMAAHHAGQEVPAALDGDECEQQDSDEDEVIRGRHCGTFRLGNM